MVLHHGKFGNRKLSIYEKNILVTGATGLLGNHFSDHLSKNNCNFKALALDDEYVPSYKNLYPEISRAYLTFQQQAGIKIKNTIYNRSPWMSYLPFFENHELPKIIKSQGGEAWHPYHKDITKELVDISHQEDLTVNDWTVNNDYDMLKMVEYGVDGIMTDYPLKLKELCDKENIKWF